MSEYKPSPEFEEKVRKAVDMPSANPKFVNQLRSELAGRPVRMRPRFILKPAWALAFAVVLLALIASAPMAVNALKRLLGYVPDVGLVENTGNLRMLAEPSSVTRDGITVTVTQVMAYEDHVELTYKVDGIAESYDTGSDMCGSKHPNNDFWSDGDAELRLPDGTVIRRDYAGKYQSHNTFAMKPVYAVSVPSNVTEMTMLLKCIPFTKLGTAPENWEVPFKLVAIPAGTVVGKPVVEVNATSEPVATEPVASKTAPLSPQVTFTLERVVQTDAGPIFYIRMHVANPDPAMVAVFPRDVYVIDSQSQKIQLMNNTMYSEDPSTEWEYVPTARPAEGALTLVVEDAIAKYADVKTFTFGAGENPQSGETWELNREFDIAGYKVEVASVRAVTFSDIEDNPEIMDPKGGPDYPEGSQGFDNGYQFSIKPGESVSNLQLDILYDSCGLTDIRPSTPAPNLYYTQLCRDGYPKGNVNVALRSLSVLMKNVGQVSWSPDGTVAPVLPKPNVTLKLEKIVPLDSATVIYFSMAMENKDPSLVSIMPLTAYVIDSQGQKIQLRGNYVWQPFEHRVGSEFEFTTQSKPAAGPLTVVVEKAVAYYAPGHVDPPQAKPSEMEFTFDAGEHPQLGQTWILNNTFEIAGYPLKVTSARATTYNEVKSTNPDFNFDSQGYEYGYDFIVETDPSEKILVEMAIMSESPVCWLNNTVSFTPDKSSIHYIQLCRDRYPTGNVKVQIWQLAVLVDNTWQAVWKP